MSSDADKSDKQLRRGYNIATVALANTKTRVLWAILSTIDGYRKK